MEKASWPVCSCGRSSQRVPLICRGSLYGRDAVGVWIRSPGLGAVAGRGAAEIRRFVGRRIGVLTSLSARDPRSRCEEPPPLDPSTRGDPAYFDPCRSSGAASSHGEEVFTA
jgi:hypothetical protein